VAARPGWNTLSAVKQGRVFTLDDDIASRARPRIVDLAHAVAEAVTKASK
jgi:iron complex transport system substrate-binding protein